MLRRIVLENIWLGRLPLKRGLVDSDRMYRDTKAIFDDLQMNIDPKAIIGRLSVSSRQMIEIATAVSFTAKIVVLDAPTSPLTEKRWRTFLKPSAS